MVSLILLSGGTGSRFGAPIPKQYLSLGNKPVAKHSFDLFRKSSLIQEIIVVCEDQYQHFFPGADGFAKPGKRRQDSVFSGLKKASQDLILVHDAARPFIEEKHIKSLIDAIVKTGAATLGVPVTNTIKLSDENRIVKKTLKRNHLWEIQTPQGARKDLYLEAFEFIQAEGIEATDDLFCFEAIQKPAEIVPASAKNFKITTPKDLSLATLLCATN